MRTIPYIHDTTTVDQTLIAHLNPAPGDLVVICSRSLTIVSLLSDVNYLFAADLFTVQDNAPLIHNGTINNPNPSITILANIINGVISVTSSGMQGVSGRNGQPGMNSPGHGEPGGQGGHGQPGGDGTPGGAITICYNTAAALPVASSVGGPGGAGGLGGAGGAGYNDPGRRPPVIIFSGRRGSDGAPGHQGASGPVTITQVGQEHLWDKLGSDNIKLWSAYRAEWATYYFRKYDDNSLKSAILELKAAIALDATNALAQRTLQQIIQQQTPSGLSRNLDVTLDYQELANNSNSGATFLQNFFSAFQNTANVSTLSTNMLQQLNLIQTQLQGQLHYAELKTIAAQQNVNIAKSQSALLANQITALQNSMNSGGFFSTLGSVLTTVGTIGGAIASIATGIGAVVSIPEAIIAVGEDFDAADSFFDFLTEKDNTDDLSKLGKGLEGVMDIEKGFVNFTKVISELKNGNRDDSNGGLGKLAELVKQKKIADLQVAQANTEVEAAQALADSLNTSVQLATNLQQQWSAEINALNTAADTMIKMARLIADKVADDIFITVRALEIYQLQAPVNLRFDYGYINPDADRELTPAIRAAQCQNTLGNMTNDILTSAQLYNSLNVAQIQGFDVVHPSLSFVIDTPVSLTGLSDDKGISFSTINITGLPAGVSELKVNAIEVAFTGPTSATPLNVWIEHSGHWLMYPHLNSSVVEFNLNPRKEIIPCKTDSTTHLLTGDIPNTQVLPGSIPFSFWGRGVLADWRLYVDATNYAAFRNVSKIVLTFHCIGFTQSGHSTDAHTALASTFHINVTDL